MPEKPEIAIFTDFLRNSLMGKKLECILITQYSTYYNNDLYSSSPICKNDTFINNINYKLINVSGYLNNVFSKGKKIVLSYNVDINNEFRIVSSCGMTGRWCLIPSKYTSIILVCEGFFVYYEDIDKKGMFSICKYQSNEYNYIFKDVGPDLMTDEVDINVYKNAITNQRIKTKKIMNFMMEQGRLSGLGNYLRSEILYRAGISPHRTLMSLNDNDIYKLFNWSKFVINESYSLGGFTIKDYYTPDGNLGKYKAYCYGRNIDNNGFNIINENDYIERKTARKIYWCPNVQI